jgi:hypothetical protein
MMLTVKEQHITRSNPETLPLILMKMFLKKLMIEPIITTG